MIGYAETRQAIDRRRRLMSAEELAESDLLLGEFGVVLTPVGDALVPPARSADLLIRRVISARLWKHLVLIVSLAGILSVLSVAVMTAAATVGENGVAPSGDGNILRAASGTAGILLSLCGQLCFVIGWRRSQSPLDFSGRYHAWKWLSAILTAAGFLAITGLSSDAAWLMYLVLESLTGPITAARPVLLLLPFAGILIYVAARILPDMRANRAALVLFSAACLLTAIQAALASGVVRPTPGLPLRLVLLLANSWLALSASLLHCRFVIHVNHHPGGTVSRTPLVPSLARSSAAAGSVEHPAVAAAEPGEGPVVVGAVETISARPGSFPADPPKVEPIPDGTAGSRKDSARQKHHRRLKNAG